MPDELRPRREASGARDGLSGRGARLLEPRLEDTEPASVSTRWPLSSNSTIFMKSVPGFHPCYRVSRPLTDEAQGVPTLTALRDSFPPAAREALALSVKETAGTDTWGRVKAFFQSQSGARSLTPRAGDDPDAVLSRAEAALRTGDLSATLDELKALPEAGQAVMAEWVANAERRLAAVDAANALEQQAK